MNCPYIKKLNRTDGKEICIHCPLFKCVYDDIFKDGIESLEELAIIMQQPPQSQRRIR